MYFLHKIHLCILNSFFKYMYLNTAHHCTVTQLNNVRLNYALQHALLL